MARVARIVLPGLPHHVTQRGNRSADVFSCDVDRQVYVSILRECSARRGLEIWAYSLLSNHVHIVAVPLHEKSLSLALRDAHTAYAAYFNRRQGTGGHVWQGRFFSCVMDEAHLWAAVRYVERNAVRAGLVKRAEEYAWSSAPAHCALREDALLSGSFPPEGVVADWSAWLADEDVVSSDRIRKQTHVGRPCGSADFLDRLESVLGLKVRPGRRGRKKR